MTTLHEYSHGPTGRIVIDTAEWPDARREAMRWNEKLHLYVVRDGRRLFAGYAFPDGTADTGNGRTKPEPVVRDPEAWAAVAKAGR